MTPREEIQKAIEKIDISRLLNVVDEYDQNGRRIMLEAISKRLTDKIKQTIMKQLGAETKIADEKIRQWLLSEIPKMYIEGANIADRTLKKYNVDILQDTLTVEALKTVADFAPHLEVVNTLLSDAYLDFGNMMTGYQRGAEHILNDAMKLQMRQSIAMGRLEGQAVNTIAKNVATTFQNRGFTVLIDRGGKSWTLENYSKMLTRTHIVRANNEGVIQRGIENGIDLVEVIPHSGACSKCTPFEGKIYSLSGQSDVYPQLTEQPPYHPNCSHNLGLRPDLQVAQYQEEE